MPPGYMALSIELLLAVLFPLAFALRNKDNNFISSYTVIYVRETG
jgi:hypothetical protein